MIERNKENNLLLKAAVDFVFQMQSLIQNKTVVVMNAFCKRKGDNPFLSPTNTAAIDGLVPHFLLCAELSSIKFHYKWALQMTFYDPLSFYMRRFELGWQQHTLFLSGLMVDCTLQGALID